MFCVHVDNPIGVGVRMRFFPRGSAYLLLELAVAMVLISVAMVGLVDGFRSVMDVRGEQNRRILARMLLEGKLEEMAFSGSLSEGVREGVFRANEAFRWQSECTSCEIADLYQVRLTVTWGGGSIFAFSFLRRSE